jgi:hypothetical protein
MKGHTEIKSRQVTGSDQCGEGKVPEIEKTPSCEATMYGEMSRGTKFDDPGPDVLGQGPMEEEHTSKTR